MTMNIIQQTLNSVKSQIKNTFCDQAITYNDVSLTVLSLDNRKARGLSEYGTDVISEAVIAIDKSDVSKVVPDKDEVAIDGVIYLVTGYEDKATFWAVTLELKSVSNRKM